MERSMLIYYADNDAEDLNLFCSIIQPGHKVETFSDPKKILKHIDKNKLPDIVFLDILIPGTAADENVQNLRKAFGRKVPIILITGNCVSENEIRRLIQSGATFFVQKPDSLFRYRDILAQLLEIDWQNYIPRVEDFQEI